MNEKIKKYMWIWLPLTILVVSVAVVWGGLALLPTGSIGGPAPDITPTMLAADGKLIEPDTAFRIGGCEGKTEAELRSMLELTPDMGYGLRLDTTATPPVWVLTLAKPLAPSTDLGVKLGLRSTTYTAAPRIVVYSRYPRSGSTDINVNSGINLTFNIDKLTEEIVKSSLVVTPPLELYIGVNDSDVTIYPQDQMAYDTDYTFTLSADKLTHPSGYTLREDFTVNIRTISELGERMERLVTMEGNDSYNITTDTAPLLGVYFDEVVYNFNATPKLSVNLYSYPDAASYKQVLVDNKLNGRKSNNAFVATTEGLTSYASFEVEPILIENGRRSSSMVPFPEPLPEGRYLAELLYDAGEGYTVKRYTLVQSSDLSVYFMHTGDSMVAWINDAATGKPAEGATFTLEGDANCPPTTTGPDGLATVKRASLGELDWGSTATMTIEWQGHTFVDSSAFAMNNTPSPNKLYTSTLFTDRPLYQGTDTIKVWGMVRPRRDTTPAPTNLTLALDEGTPIDIVLDAGGFFTAELPLDSYNAGYYWLSLNVDDKVLAQDVLRVYNYIKPVYTAKITTPQSVYLLDDISSGRVALDVNVASFDGTPTPVWQGTIGQEWGQEDVKFAGNGNLTTDDNGNAVVAVTSVNTMDYDSWSPRQLGLTLRNRGAESENYLSSTYLYVVPRDLMLVGKMKASGGTATVTVNTNRVDLTRVNAETADGTDPREHAALETLLRGKAVSTKVKATLYSTSFSKTQSGSSYDYINRVTVPTYKYKRVENTEKEMVVTTDERGVATIPDLPCVAEDKSYRLELSAVDGTGKPVKTSVYLSMEISALDSHEAYYYSLRKVVDTTKLLEQNDGSSYSYDWRYRSQFADNETVTFRLNDNYVPISQMKGRILWSTVQTDFERVTITDSDLVSIPFAEDLLPNYSLVGAYFDGKNVFPLQVTRMEFDATLRELAIALDTTSDTYHPGDKVDIAATVTEQATGKPATNAEVVIAVVDEAIFALQAQTVDPLRDLYDAVFHPIINQFSSTAGGNPDSGNEMGGGGGETTIRDKFPDTALFATAKTDANGHASFALTLPDSITSWRMTSIAITDKGYAGNVKENFVATKEFFVTPSVSSELLVGDSFTVGLRGAGKGVATTDPVSYTVTVQGVGDSKTQTVTTNGIREYGWATFDGLVAGDYTVTVTGSCMDYTDGVKLPFAVLATGLEMSRQETISLADGIKINPLRYPVNITLYNPAYELYNEVLWAARSQSYGSRADMQLGLAVTGQLLSQTSGDGSSFITSPDILLPYTNEHNQLRLFPHDKDPDMRLNAMAQLVASDLRGYWNDGAASPSLPWEQAAPGAFYLLKATVGVYSNGDEVGFDSMSLVDKLDVGIAHVIADDIAFAAKLYDTEVAPRLQKLTGTDGTTALFLPEVAGKSSHDCTAAALRLAIMLDHKDSSGLMRYLLDRPSTRDPYIMEKLLYLSRTKPSVSGIESKVSYTLDGKQMTADLVADGMTLLSLSRNQLETLDIKVTAGQALATLQYTAEPDSAALANQKLKITKTVVPADGGDSYKVGDRVKVTLTPDLTGLATGIGDGELVIDDYLPSGMKFDRYEPKYNSNTVNWYVTSREGQRLRFTTYLDQGRLVPVVYYARNAMPGKYVVEGAMVSAGSTWGSSERDSLTILP